MLNRHGIRKHLAAIAAWLLAVVIAAALADLVIGKSLVLIVKPQERGSVQVFLPAADGVSYDERRSQRYGYQAGIVQHIAFDLGDTIPRRVRLDPFDGPIVVRLARLEISNVFSKATVQGSGLATRIVVTQNVEQEVDLPTSDVILRGTGSDPGVLIDLEGLVLEPKPASYVAIFLAAALCHGLFTAPMPSMRRRRMLVFALPLMCAALLTVLFFPGYMTYDSLHALRGARNGVVDSAWPPFVSYTWRAVDVIVPHPAAMLFSQVCLLLASTSAIVFHYTRRLAMVTLVLVITLLIPVVLGSLAVIWKDVLMAAYFTAAFAVMLPITTATGRWSVLVRGVVALLLLFCGTATRHNAITAAVPLTFYVAWLVASSLAPSRRGVVAVSLGLVAVAGIIGAKLQLDRYALPGLEPLTGVTDLVPIVRKMDLIATAICANDNFLAAAAPGLTIDDMRALYDPRHSNLSLALLNRIPADWNVDEAWIEALKKHPACFWNNKLQLMTHLVGANAGEQFMITAPQVDPNEYGYYLPRSSARILAEHYIISASRWFFLRPWFVYSITAIALIYALSRRRVEAGQAVLWLSTALYASGLFMFGNAADARLLFYANFMSPVLLLLLLFTRRPVEPILAGEPR